MYIAEEVNRQRVTTNQHIFKPGLGIWDKLEDNWKRDLVFTGNTFDNLNIKKIEVKSHLRTCGLGIFKMFLFFKMRDNNKILKECYEDNFI